MAVFLINICKFNGCGITFPSLGDLIQHIEDTHIDYDPKVVEQKEQAQPACLPLSYVLRFISDAARKEGPFLGAAAAGVELKRKLAIKHHSYSMPSSNRSNTPTGSDLDDEEMVVSESEDSNDSWTTEEFSSEFIMRYGSRHSGSVTNGIPGSEKPFACPVPGCKKRYKNVNGIKYHSKNGHKKDGKVRKGYKCHCGKSYKTAQGLKSHALVAHNASPDNVLASQHVAIVTNSSSGICSMPRSSSPSQSLGSMSPSSISNMSSSNGSCNGGSNSSNINNGSSNSLQHLTTVVGSNNCLTAITNGNHSNHPQQQLQQQQQLIATVNNTNMNSQQLAATLAATVSESSFLPFNGSPLFIDSSLTSTTMTKASPTPTPPPSPPPPPPLVKASNFANNQSLALYHQQFSRNINSKNNKNIISYNNDLNNTDNNLFLSPASPKFIEHKCSANIFKEKFFSNLRQINKNETFRSKNNLIKSGLNGSTESVGIVGSGVGYAQYNSNDNLRKI